MRVRTQELKQTASVSTYILPCGNERRASGLDFNFAGQVRLPAN